MVWVFEKIRKVCAMDLVKHKTTTLLALAEAGCAKTKKHGALLKRCRAVVSMERKVKPNHVCFLHKSLKSLLLES